MAALVEEITPQLAHANLQQTAEEEMLQHPRDNKHERTPLPAVRLDSDYTDKFKSKPYLHHASESFADSLVSVPLSEEDSNAAKTGEAQLGSTNNEATITTKTSMTTTTSTMLNSHEHEDDEKGRRQSARLSAELSLEGTPRHSKMRRDSAETLEAVQTMTSSDRPNDRNVNWSELDKNEEETKSEVADEATALLLARLEQENNALAGNPKSALSTSPKNHLRKTSRPLSVDQIRNLIDDPGKRSSLRCSLHFSQLPTPQMTELEFWAALVSDYTLTANRLPTLTTAKIRGGVPPPLRGVVWPSIAGAQDSELMAEFERLSLETSPYELAIGKDIGRSFPNVEMFRDPEGEGQRMLAKVLKCYSLYDTKIGYCQGLGFVVGPLLMHMSDAESFCVLVRLMDHYDLRSCFLPTLSGLQLRTYQFQTLMARHLPKLHAHLEKLGVEPVYVSQWFLSFFGVTCPLPMLLRIYDVLLVEGACETLMRVALSLMQRNETKLLSLTEYSDVMQLLLSRSLWDTYAYSADDLVEDFVSLTAMVTRESLDSLEEQYERQKSGGGSVQFPALQAAAARFLGRLWSGNNGGSAAPSIKSQANGASGTSTPTTKESLEMKRTPSKQSMASTLNSMDTASSDTSTAPTESWNSGSDASGTKKHKRQNTVTSSRNTDRDRDLNAQIEDLLMALTELQRAQAELARDLQREREEREEDQKIALRMLAYIKERPDGDGCQEMIEQATERFVATRSTSSKRTSIVQSKGQLQEEVAHWKEKHTIEATRCHELTRTLDDKEAGMSMLRDELRETRSRLQESYAEKQRLERTVKGLRHQQQERELRDSQGSKRSSTSTAGSGLRELRLGRTDSIISQGSLHSSASPTTTFNKRSSSLGIPLSSSAMQASSSAASSSPSAWVSPMPAIPAEDSPATARPAVTVAVPRDASAAAATTGSYMSSPTAISPQPQTSQPCQSSQPASQPSSSETTTQTAQQSKENKQSSAANQEQDPETLLLELVQSKTQEAIARQELEEVKAKLDSLRRLIKREGGADSIRRGRTPSPGSSVSSVPSLNSPRTRLSAASGASFLSADPKSLSAPNNLSRSVTTTAVSPPATGAARFFSGWGRKAADAK